MCHWCDECQKVQTQTRRGVGDAAAGLGLHFLHMSEGPFSHDAGHLPMSTFLDNKQTLVKYYIEQLDIKVFLYSFISISRVYNE